MALVDFAPLVPTEHCWAVDKHDTVHAGRGDAFEINFRSFHHAFNETASRSCGGAQLRRDLHEDGVENAFEYFLLGAEMMINRTLGDAGPLRDVVDGRGSETSRCKFLPRSSENRAPCRLAP